MLISMGWPQLLCNPSMIPSCRLGIQKLHIHWNVFWIWNLFRRGQPLADRSAPRTKRPADHVDVVYRDVIAGSRESRGHHHDGPFIYRILKSLLPQNNTFFIATASVVKDAVDTSDCQGLREQWYYLRFYVRRTMPPTVNSQKTLLRPYGWAMWRYLKKR